MNNNRKIESPELAAIETLVNMYALRLARAYVAKDAAAANEIYEYIYANFGITTADCAPELVDIYKQRAVEIIKERAADMVISSFVK